MDLLVYLVVSLIVAKGLMMIGGVDGRSGPAGLFRGMFSSPNLGWPRGVQEEDRERAWSWDSPPTEPDDVDLIDVGDVTVEPAPVQRLR